MNSSIFAIHDFHLQNPTIAAQTDPIHCVVRVGDCKHLEEEEEVGDEEEDEEEKELTKKKIAVSIIIFSIINTPDIQARN